MGSINVTSLISHRTKRPMVDIQMVPARAQLEFSEAVQLAMNIMAAAEAAQTDAYLFEFFTKRMGVEEAKAYAAIADYRSFRTAMEKSAGGEG